MHDHILTNHEPLARPRTPAPAHIPAWTHTPARKGLLACTLIGVLALADVAAADGPEQTAARDSVTAAAPTAAGAAGRGVQQRPDFVFGQPGYSLGIRGLWKQADAGSDLYDFVTEELTLERSDFNAPGIAVDVGFAVTSRLEARVGVDFSRSSARSQNREYPVDTEGVPIEQETELSQFAVTGSLAFALAPRGRAIGQYAWIPARVVPYVGVGGGLTRYEFVQFGDWVDFVDLAVFTAEFGTRGWGLGGHVLGGVDIRMASQALLTLEVRRVWAQAEVVGDFFGEFDPIDLGGLDIGVGVRLVF